MTERQAKAFINRLMAARGRMEAAAGEVETLEKVLRAYMHEESIETMQAGEYTVIYLEEADKIEITRAKNEKALPS